MECPNCKKQTTIMDGYHVCPKCGLVVGEVLVSEPQVTEEGEIIGTGPPQWPGIAPQQTVVSSYIKGRRGRITPLEAHKIRKLSEVAERTTPRGQKRLTAFLSEIRRIAKMPEVRLSKSAMEEAILLGRKVYKEKLTRGRPLDILAAGVVAVVCSRTKHLVTLDVIAKQLNVNTKELRKCVSFLKKRLGVSYVSISCKDWLPRVISYLTSEYKIPMRQNDKIVELTNKLYREMERRGLLSGKNPLHIAVAIVVAAMESVTGKKFLVDDTILSFSKGSRTTILKRLNEARKLCSEITSSRS